MEIVTLNGLSEITEFVIKYNTVSPDYVQRNLFNCVILNMQFDNGKLIGTVAIKNKNSDHRFSVSKLSGYELTKDFNELGYLVIHPEHRHKRLGTLLVSSLLRNYEGKLFATSSSIIAEKILIKFGFRKVGNSWKSLILPENSVSLYVRE